MVAGDRHRDGSRGLHVQHDAVPPGAPLRYVQPCRAQRHGRRHAPVHLAARVHGHRGVRPHRVPAPGPDAAAVPRQRVGGNVDAVRVTVRCLHDVAEGQHFRSRPADVCRRPRPASDVQPELRRTRHAHHPVESHYRPDRLAPPVRVPPGCRAEGALGRHELHRRCPARRRSRHCDEVHRRTLRQPARVGYPARRRRCVREVVHAPVPEVPLNRQPPGIRPGVGIGVPAGERDVGAYGRYPVPRRVVLRDAVVRGQDLHRGDPGGERGLIRRRMAGAAGGRQAPIHLVVGIAGEGVAAQPQRRGVAPAVPNRAAVQRQRVRRNPEPVGVAVRSHDRVREVQEPAAAPGTVCRPAASGRRSSAPPAAGRSPSPLHRIRPRPGSSPPRRTCPRSAGWHTRPHWSPSAPDPRCRSPCRRTGRRCSDRSGSAARRSHPHPESCRRSASAHWPRGRCRPYRCPPPAPCRRIGGSHSRTRSCSSPAGCTCRSSAPVAASRSP